MMIFGAGRSLPGGCILPDCICQAQSDYQLINLINNRIFFLTLGLYFFLLFIYKSSSLHLLFSLISIANMSKIVVCFDGTGNSYQGNTSDTNIVKLYQKLDRTRPNQFHYYQRKSILSSTPSLMMRARASC